MQQGGVLHGFRRLDAWRRTRQGQSTLTLLLAAIAPVLVLVTFLGFGAFGLPNNPALLRAALLLDLVYVLLLAGLAARRIARMVAARRMRSAGSRLHMRLTRVFTLIALAPTVLVAVFATVSLNFGLEGWFSERVRNVVGNSLAAAQAYEDEHRETLIADAQVLAGWLDAQRAGFVRVSDGQLRELLTRGQLQMQRALTEAFVIDAEGEIVARGDRSYLFGFEDPGPENLSRAAAGEIVVIEDYAYNEFRGLIALRAYPGLFLYVTREVDGAILELLDETRATVGLYEQLERDRGRLLFEFALIYLGFALIVILAAVWLGLWFAERLARPVGRLAAAAERVGAGDLDVQVREEQTDDEIATLSQVFNRMTRQVRGQRDALLAINVETETRRRLFDSVLSSVTAGVIGLDPDGRVEMINTAAERLLSLGRGSAEGRTLERLVPEFAELFERLSMPGQSVAQGSVRLVRAGTYENLLVRITRRQGIGTEPEGYVVTFDDVTDLVSAQRMAAWGDVARRIAHEIKNPLTPIQLSAERMKRKFGPMLGEERASLEQYAEVIIRQTNDLRRIVDEFSKFARMPAPERKRLDIIELIRGAVLLQRSTTEAEVITASLPPGPLFAHVDGTMIGQAMTNLLKNAAEAIEARAERDGAGSFAPQIRVVAEPQDGALRIVIQDNGIGLPEGDRSRLFEPYVTLRDKGTGLGLSIVRKIIEEHDGTLDLTDAPPLDPGSAHCGAQAIIIVPLLAEVVSSARQTPGTTAGNSPGNTPGQQPETHSADETRNG